MDIGTTVIERLLVELAEVVSADPFYRPTASRLAALAKAARRGGPSAESAIREVLALLGSGELAHIVLQSSDGILPGQSRIPVLLAALSAAIRDVGEDGRSELSGRS